MNELARKSETEHHGFGPRSPNLTPISRTNAMVEADGESYAPIKIDNQLHVLKSCHSHFDLAETEISLQRTDSMTAVWCKLNFCHMKTLEYSKSTLVWI